MSRAIPVMIAFLAGGASVAATVGGPPVKTPDHGPPRVEVSDQQVMDSFDAHIAGETPDAGWQAEIATRTAAVFDHDDARGVEVRAVGCGETLCRVDLAVADEPSFRGFDRYVAGMGGTGSGVWVHLESERDRDPEIYLTREGMRLPPVP